MTFEQHARSFGLAADAYDRGRPGYPDESAAWAVHGGPGTVGPVPFAVDVGAGTGKFTRVLQPLADRVVAVEPDTAMRARLASSLPGVEARAGTGEALPLDDGTADVVTFAQSWHWVDPVAGSAEAARVLRPGGALALLWNVRDETTSWSRRLGDLLQRPASRTRDHVAPAVGAPFGQASRERFDWVHEQDRSAFLDMVASRSYVIVLPASERRALLDAVGRLLDEEPETAGRATVPVPYTTHVLRYVRP